MLVETIGLGLLTTGVANCNLVFDGTLDTLWRSLQQTLERYVKVNVINGIPYPRQFLSCSYHPVNNL